MQGKPSPLYEWAHRQNPQLFIEPHLDIKGHYDNIQKWLSEQKQYGEDNVTDFLDGADAELIAYAMALRTEGAECAVVTMEVPANKNARQKIQVKIPDVCSEFKVPCYNIFRVLREEGARFVLDPACL